MKESPLSRGQIGKGEVDSQRGEAAVLHSLLVALQASQQWETGANILSQEVEGAALSEALYLVRY